MKLTLESPELTALVLGELTEDRCQEVEAIVSTRPDLQAEVEQLRQLTKLVGTALQSEPAWQLSAERRQLILKKGTPRRTSRRRKTRHPVPTELLGWFPWTGWAIGVSVTGRFWTGLPSLPSSTGQPSRGFGTFDLQFRATYRG